MLLHNDTGAAYINNASLENSRTPMKHTYCYHCIIHVLHLIVLYCNDDDNNNNNNDNNNNNNNNNDIHNNNTIRLHL